MTPARFRRPSATRSFSRRALERPGRDALDAAAVLGRSADVDLIQVVGDCGGSKRSTSACKPGCSSEITRASRFATTWPVKRSTTALTPLRRRQLHTRALDALGDDA